MKFALVFFLLATTSALASNEKAGQPPPQIDPAKPATVTLPIQDWQAVLASISDSAHVSAREANRITQNVVAQIQPQLLAIAASHK